MGPIPLVGTVGGVPDINVVVEGVFGVIGDDPGGGMRGWFSGLGSTGSS